MKRFLKILVIAGLVLSLGLGTLSATTGLYDAYKLTFGEARWQTKINDFMDAAAASYNYLVNQIAATNAVVTAVGTQVTNWVSTVDSLTLIQPAPAYSDNHTFTLTGDYSSLLSAGKRLVADCGADGLKPNTVVSCTYGAPTSTVVVTVSNLTNNLAAVSYYATRNGLNTYGSGDVVAGEYGSPSWAHLQSAAAVANAAGRRLLLTPGAWPVTGDLTITAPFCPVPGATCAVATTKTLTLATPPQAAAYQIFSFAGTGKVLFGAGAAENVRPEWFGAPQGDTGDGAAAFTLMATAINNAGSGSVRLSPATYRLIAPKTFPTPVCAFTSLTGIEIKGPGATIHDAQTYASGEVSALFQFTACNNVKVSGPLKVTSFQNPDAYYTTNRGLYAVYFQQGCVGMDVDLETSGGEAGVCWYRLYTDSITYQCRQARVRLKAYKTHYPVIGQFGLHGAEIDLDADGCGRNVYFYGSDQLKFRVKANNQQSTTIFAGFEGYGCRDIEMAYWDIGSTSGCVAAPLMSIEWKDSIACVMGPFKLNMNVSNSGTWGHTITLNKFYYVDGVPTSDTTSRGHQLDGFELSGVMGQTGTSNYHVYSQYGSFAGSDSANNINIHDLRLAGTAPINLYFPACLNGMARFNDVVSAHNLVFQNGSTGKTIFQGCKALNFSAATTDTDYQTLIGCTISNGTVQSTINKLFIDCDGAGCPAPGDFCSVPETDYAATSIVTGWSAFTTKTIKVKKIGKTVRVNFDIDGTSNSTSAYFTVPYYAKTGCNYYAGLPVPYDAGSAVANGQAFIGGGTNVIYCNKSLGAAWTNTATEKVVKSQIEFETD